MSTAGDKENPEVQFGEPPVKTRYDWWAIAEQLRSRPGEWAMVFEGGLTSTVNAIRQGHVNAVRSDLGFEITTLNNTREQPRTCDLWMRYNPDKKVV